MELKLKSLEKAEMVVFESALEHVETSIDHENFKSKEVINLSYVNVRGSLEDEKITDVIKNLGFDIPKVRSFTNSKDGAEGGELLWISPDELLAVLPQHLMKKFFNEANSQFKDLFACAIDNSGGFTTLVFGGNKYLEIFSKLIPYEIDNESLKIGEVLSTSIQSSPAIIYRCDDESIKLITRFTFADYLWKVIMKAAEEYI